jgi:hypothetical protein
MGRIQQLIGEISELKKEANHRNALQIHQILANNKPLFLQQIDPDYFNPVFTTFERLSNAGPAEYNSENFKREFERSSELLSFHLNRII